VEGYWRNWERDTVWLMREIVFAMMQGNPYIEEGGRPASPKDIIKIKDDDHIQEQKIIKKVTPEELEEVKRRFMGLRDKK
jgi:hypothetical protein